MGGGPGDRLGTGQAGGGGPVHQVVDGAHAPARGHGLVDGPVHGLGEGLRAQVVRPDLGGEHRDLDHDLQDLALELGDGVGGRGQGPGRGRGHQPRLLLVAALAPLHLAHGGDRLLLGHPHPPRQAAGVLPAQGQVTDPGHHGGGGPQPGDPPLGGVQVEVVQGGADDELEQGHTALQQAGDT